MQRGRKRMGTEFKFGFVSLIRNSQFEIRNERNILPLAKCNHMVRLERSAHYSKIPIDGQRILSVRFVPNTIKLAFASAKGFLNYELRITNYEFGRRPPNSNLNVYHFPYYTPFRPESQAPPPLEREKRAVPLGGRVRLSLFLRSERFGLFHDLHGKLGEGYLSI